MSTKSGLQIQITEKFHVKSILFVELLQQVKY